MPSLINVPFAVFAVLALNTTVFAMAVQMNLLTIDSDLSKVISWACAVGLWHMAYRFRHPRH